MKSGPKSYLLCAQRSRPRLGILPLSMTTCRSNSQKRMNAVMLQADYQVAVCGSSGGASIYGSGRCPQARVQHLGLD